MDQKKEQVNLEISKKTEKSTNIAAQKEADNTTIIEKPLLKLEDFEKQDQHFLALTKVIKAGCHLGLKANQWNPKMKPFIYTKKYNYIFDVKKTILFAQKSFNYLHDLTKAGGEILFVGTKNKQVSPLIAEAAKREKIHFITQRWLGGTLTNYRHCMQTIKKLNDLEILLADEEKRKNYTKKELFGLLRQKEKLEKFYGGIKELKKIPNAIVIFDPVLDNNAVKEAKKLNIPIVALSNTNANPDFIDFIVPCNNFSICSVYIMANLFADATALANGKETVIAYKSAEEIELPEILKKKEYVNANKIAGFVRQIPSINNNSVK